MTGGVGNGEAKSAPLKQAGCGYCTGVQSVEPGVDLSTIRGEGRCHRPELRGAYVRSHYVVPPPARRAGDMAPGCGFAYTHCVYARRPSVCSQCLSAAQLPAHCALTGHPRTRAAESQRSRAAAQPCAMGQLQLPRNYEGAITNALNPFHLSHLPNRRHAIGDGQAGNAFRAPSPTRVAPLGRHYPIGNGAIAHAPARRQGDGAPMKTIGKRAPADRPPRRLLERPSSRLTPVYGSQYWVPTAHSPQVPGCPSPEPPRAPHSERPRP